MTPSLQNILNYTRQELRTWFSEHGYPPYRGDQLFEWVYKKRIFDFQNMTNLPLELRTLLCQAFTTELPLVTKEETADDGTIKYVVRLADDRVIETVYMPHPSSIRATVCLSTQVGCPLQCRFCVTGAMGFARNLSAAEIISQYLLVRDAHPHIYGWNVVYMGMGEPLLNLEAVNRSLDILWDPHGIGLGPRHTTVSTVGIIPGIQTLMQRTIKPRLAVSLHAPNSELRASLMPIERVYPLHRLLNTLRQVPLTTRREWITFEYVLLRGVNDTREIAQDLARKISPFRCKVNLIPYNPAEFLPFTEPTEENVSEFARILRSLDIHVTVRRSRGRRVMAACGQLGYNLARTRIAPQEPSA